MTIELIAKNKVADYIQHNPEAYTYFITWLKEAKYRNRTRFLDANSTDGTVTCQAQLGASKYTIQFIVNIGHKTACIIFFGTREEDIAFHQKEAEKFMAKHPGEKIVSKTIAVTVKSPAISKNASSSYNETIPMGEAEELAFPDSINNDQLPQTNDEYEKNLEKAIEIFKSPPGTDGFNELGVLLPLIKSYEGQNMKLPRFNILEALKLRMQDFQLTPKDMIYNIGNEEDVELFLSGKKIPSNTILKKVYKQLALKLPPKRDDFIME